MPKLTPEEMSNKMVGYKLSVQNALKKDGWSIEQISLVTGTLIQGEKYDKLKANNKALLEAAKEAQKLVSIARGYFPKSIKNTHTFTLENVSATINKALAVAEGNNVA